jgi:hypothetical protein
VAAETTAFASTAEQLLLQLGSALSADINDAFLKSFTARPCLAGASAAAKSSFARTGESPDGGNYLNQSIELDATMGSDLPTRPSAAAVNATGSSKKALVSLAFDLLAALDSNSEMLDHFDERFAGYFYQFSCESLREEALERIQSADKKSSTQDLISFTQLYTPDWVADFLLSSTLPSLWSGGSANCELNTNFNLQNLSTAGDVLGRSAGSLSVLDPACGAGHILLRAFDLLLLMHVSEGVSIEDAVQIILNKNLYGCDLDLSALWVCGFSIMVKAMSIVNSPLQVRMNLQSASNNNADLTQLISHKPPTKKPPKNGAASSNSPDLSLLSSGFDPGSLNHEVNPDHLLAKKYDVVVANPPYIGRRLMDRRMKSFLKQNFPTAHSDISAAFLVRALQLCKSSGKVAFITQSSLLYLPSFGQVRRDFIANRNVEKVVELGTRVFPLSVGEKINSMLIVLNAAGLPVGQKSQFLDLSRASNKFDELNRLYRFWQITSTTAEKASSDFVNRDCNEFLENREFAFNYRCPRILLEVIRNCKRLAAVAEIKQGLATSDNKRFVRFWWDTLPEELGKRWHPYIKGAGTERWLSSCQTVLDWGGDGQAIKAAVEINYPYLKGRTAWVVKNEQYYFRPGLTFSFVSTGNFAVRRMPAGCIFDVGGSALFCDEDHAMLLLAYLNSSFAAVCAQLLNPTFNFQVGDIKEIPFPEFSVAQQDEMLNLSIEACKLKEYVLSFDESNLFVKTAAQIKEALLSDDIDRIWQEVDSQQRLACSRLAALEQNLDQIVWQVLSTKHSFSASEKKQLEQILNERCQTRKPESLAFASSSEFARALLRSHLMDLSSDRAISNIDLTDVVFSRLRSWCEPHLKQDLASYFNNGFNKDQEKNFLGSPRLLLYFDHASQNFFCLSNSATRKLLHSADGPNNAGVGKGSDMIARLSGTLKCIDNWTGKDFYATAERLYS